MTEPDTGDDRDDGSKLEPTCDGGWAWANTRSAGSGAEITDAVEDVEYAAILCVINGVNHIQIAEVDAEKEDSGTIPGRTIRSSHFHDLDEMR